MVGTTTVPQALTREEVQQELDSYCTSVGKVRGRYISMRAAHPEAEELIREVFDEHYGHLMGDHTFAGGL